MIRFLYHNLQVAQRYCMSSIIDEVLSLGDISYDGYFHGFAESAAVKKMKSLQQFSLFKTSDKINKSARRSEKCSLHEK